MGLFDFMKNTINKNSSNIDLAEGLFGTLTLSTSSSSEKERKQIEVILKQCPTRQDVLNKAIELCGEPNSARQRYLYAKAYSWSKVEYRKLAIKYVEFYLRNPIYEEAFKNRHSSYGGKRFSFEDMRNIHLSEMYYFLGQAYEGEYEFDKAFLAYQKELELTPFWPAPYCHVCSILVKQNKLDEAMESLLNAKRSSFYKPIKYKSLLGESCTEDTFKKVIDSQITELQVKIDKGYIYRPRKRK